MTTTKHQQLIQYIENLQVSDKVSVRQLAKGLDVSEGTAYRAIKEAESMGLVSSIPKVGTIRIAREQDRRIEDLTIQEIKQIVEAVVLAGQDNLDWMPAKFLIGAMSAPSLERLVEEKTLLIVGDQTQQQLLALEKGAALLITGGFTPSQEVVKLAKEKNLPLLISAYDTFALTSMINRSIYDRMVEKELILAEDIMVQKVHYLKNDDTVADWYQLSQKTHHSRFPVVNEEMEVIGMTSAVDVAGVSNDTCITEVMSPQVFTAEKNTSVTHLSRIMVWEGYEMVPVVEQGKLLGVVSRKDVIEAFQVIQKQPHFGETVDNLIISGFRILNEAKDYAEVEGTITHFMTNEFGAASSGTVVTLLNSAAYILIRKSYKLDTVTDNYSIYHLEPIAVGTKVRVAAQVLYVDKRLCKVETSIYQEERLVVRGLITSRVVKK